MVLQHTQPSHYHILVSEGIFAYESCCPQVLAIILTSGLHIL